MWWCCRWGVRSITFLSAKQTATLRRQGEATASATCDGSAREREGEVEEEEEEEEEEVNMRPSDRRTVKLPGAG